MKAPTFDEEIEALLPFYVNGTATEAERARVERARAEDPGIAAEIAFLEALRAGMRADEEPDAYSPGELGLTRLQREMRNGPHQDARAAAPVRRGRWQAMAMAASVALFLGIGAGTLLTPMLDDGTYRAADGSAESTSGPVLQISFVPTATEQDIRALLTRNNLSIVAGPSALGIYRAVLRDADPATLARVLRSLSDRKDVVAGVVPQ